MARTTFKALLAKADAIQNGSLIPQESDVIHWNTKFSSEFETAHLKQSHDLFLMVVDSEGTVEKFVRLLDNATRFESMYFMLRFNKFSKHVTIPRVTGNSDFIEFNVNAPELVAERIEMGY